MGYSVRDIVRKIDTYWYGDLNEVEELGKLYVISEVSGDDDYEIRDLITGGHSAWWHNDQLEYVGRADKKIFKKLDAIQDKAHKRNISLKYIERNYPNISTDSWLELFKQIGYNSSFYKNGEYFILFAEIQTLKPIFDAIFEYDLEKAIEETNKAFKKGYREQYLNNIKQFFSKIKGE